MFRRVVPGRLAAGLAFSALVLGACGGGAGHAAAPTTTTAPPLHDASPGETLAAFTAAWQRQDWPTMAAYVQSPPDGFEAELASTYRGIDATDLRVQAGAPAVAGDGASAPVTQDMVVAGHGPVTLATTVDLVSSGGQWLVSWSWSSLESELAAGSKLTLVPTQATRAGIDGANNRPLATLRPVVQVGLDGARITQPGLVRRLLVAGGATPAEAAAALRSARADPTQFVPVFTVSRADYEQRIRPGRLYSVAGTEFEATTQLVPVTADLGQELIGGLGPVTAEELSSLGPTYHAGDVVGQGGLEGQYEKQLAGTPGADLDVVDANGAVVATVQHWAPTAGTAVHTSISVAAQQAAEAAIAGTATPSALVAVRASTGQIVAMATHDPTGSGFDWALDAAEPPGSTFKIVTTSALVTDAHATPATPTSCTPTRTVDGETFHNDAGESYGTIDLLTAFARSCNTSFIGLASADLQPRQLAAEASTWGLGVTPTMGYPAYGGHVPVPTDLADLAAASIGQGQTTVSPLDMAMVAAAADTGVVRPARLVAGAPADTAPTHRLGPVVIADLHAMMAAVVISGTASGAGLPAGTYGKTGTAEFGTANPPQTHAWFVGYRGDVAFAVYVDLGVAGAAVAAPLAASWLRAVAPLGL